MMNHIEVKGPKDTRSGYVKSRLLRFERIFELERASRSQRAEMSAGECRMKMHALEASHFTVA